MLNQQFTDKLSRWLALPERDEKDLREGAELLLAVTHDARLYARCISNPQRMASFMLYRLRKILDIRLAGLTMQQVEEMQAETMPKVAEAITAEAVAAEDKRGGRRPDHDKLPEKIQKLWERNAVRWNKIKKTYNQLLAMNDAPPCDRYEYVKNMKDAWYKYRADMNKYDDYAAATTDAE